MDYTKEEAEIIEAVRKSELTTKEAISLAEAIIEKRTAPLATNSDTT
jgi:hypothetical protein